MRKIKFDNQRFFNYSCLLIGRPRDSELKKLLSSAEASTLVSLAVTTSSRAIFKTPVTSVLHLKDKILDLGNRTPRKTCQHF